MLSNTHFYHRITRKIVVAFGTMFNNMKLYRYNKAGTTEIERVNVPLSYAGKEKYYVRTTQDPDLAQTVQLTLPSMSFEMTSITYDPLRKRSSFVQEVGRSANTNLQINSAPYNLEFNLYIYVRNVEDGTQLIEQILPYFSPDYTLTVDLSTISNLKVDVPIVLQSINQELSSDVGMPDDERTIIWTLTFTAKAYMYGPIPSAGSSKVITQAIGNIYHDNREDIYGQKTLVLSGCSGEYKVGERVYQGRTLLEATATAFVSAWDTTNNLLVLSEIDGVFTSNTEIRGVLSGTECNVTSIGTADFKMARVSVRPNPATANVTDDFGFTTIIQEFPEITSAINNTVDSTIITVDSTIITVDSF